MVGSGVGTALGELEGPGVGTLIGRTGLLALSVGLREGKGVGMADGRGVGLIVGSEVVGRDVEGRGVGTGVLAAVGRLEGCRLLCCVVGCWGKGSVI